MVEWFDDLALGMRFKSSEKVITREESLYTHSLQSPSFRVGRFDRRARLDGDGVSVNVALDPGCAAQPGSRAASATTLASRLITAGVPLG
jgi:hypothetical protein